MYVPVKYNKKINIYNNIYIQLLFKNKLNLPKKNYNISILNNYFLKTKKKKFNNILFNFFNHYFINFMNFFLKKKLFFCLKKLNYLTANFKKNKTLDFMSKKLKKYYNFAGDSKFFKEFIEIVWLSFLLKDSKFFLNWLKNLMEKINLKNHKKFLNLLKLVLTRYYNFFFLNSNVLGIFFDIRGKLGVTGNAKKRHMKITTGTYSSTKKKNKISFSQSVIRTSTGVLGVTFCIFF
jgi:hypothetical protein